MLRHVPAWPMGFVQLAVSPSVGSGKSAHIVVIPCYLFLPVQVNCVVGVFKRAHSALLIRLTPIS
jgi:hypothetical protein